MEHESIADLHECELVRRLLFSPISRGTIIGGVYGMPQVLLDRQQVGLEDTPGNVTGNLDILLCARLEGLKKLADEVKPRGRRLLAKQAFASNEL
jgi:hypothetical protein